MSRGLFSQFLTDPDAIGTTQTVPMEFLRICADITYYQTHYLHR